MDENARATKAAGVIGSATLISRIFGYIRDMVMAAFLGAGLVSDAFFVAFTIPNLLRRLFAEGSLTIAFVPVFTEQLEKFGKDEAFAMARSALKLLSVILVLVTIAGILFSPQIIHVVGHGYLDDPVKFSLTVDLTRIMFAYVFFICLVALAMGILNALGHFAAPALAPVLLNIAMIAALWGVSFFSDNSVTRVMVLAWGVIAGGVLQLGLQVPFLIKAGLRLGKKAGLFHPALKKVGLLMLPAVFGASVYQINIIIGRMLATMLPEGSVTYLYYADRLVQFPLGVFAISGAMAVLPSLSRQAAAKDVDAMINTFGYALKMILFISIPAMVGLVVLREPLVALLFQRGKFSEAAVSATAYALFFYGIGLWAVSAVRVVVPTFYALSDTRTPVVIAIIATITNIFLSIGLMGPLGHGGLALATSLSAVVNLILLLWALRRKLGSLGLTAITRSVAKSMVCSAGMGVVVWWISWYSMGHTDSFWRLLIGISVSVIAGCVSYGTLAYLLKSQEMKSLLQTLRNKAA